jgi:uncharacterized repeat protein (TIGR01451 family)
MTLSWRKIMSTNNHYFLSRRLYAVSMCIFWLLGCVQLPKDFSGVRQIVPQGPPRSSIARNKDGVELIVTTTPSTAAPGEKIMYEITIKNTGNAAINIYATIPNYTTVALTEASLRAVCNSGKAVCQPAEQIGWGQSSFGSPYSNTVYFHARVAANPPAPNGARLRSLITSPSFGLTVYAEPVVELAK